MATTNLGLSSLAAWLIMSVHVYSSLVALDLEFFTLGGALAGLALALDDLSFHWNFIKFV